MAYTTPGQVAFHFLGNSARAAYHALYAASTATIQFNHVSKDAGVGGAVKHLWLATSNLYSAVFGTAGILLGRPRLLAPVFAAATALSTWAIVQDDVLDFNHRVQHDVKQLLHQNGPLKENQFAKDNNLFAENRRLDWYRLDSRHAVYNPKMIEKYKKDETVRSYVNLIIQEAKKNGLNPVWFANQLYHESNSFDKRVILGLGKYANGNHKGAVGIAQFLPETAAHYGSSVEDLKDPYKAISLAAKHMSVLTRQYSGDQILAMIAYNGGENLQDNPDVLTPVKFVESSLGKENITGREWMDYMYGRRNDRNFETGYIPNAWHNETYKYVAIITGASWSDSMKLSANNIKFNAFTFSPNL